MSKITVVGFMVGKDNHLLYLCAMRKLSMDELNRKSVEEFKASDKMPVIVVLDNIRSMHNVGSVFRTSDAFLLQGIFLCGYTPQPPHRDIHKTALGATETVAWKYTATTVEAVQELRNAGYQVWAIEQVENSISLDQFIHQNLATATKLNSLGDGIKQPQRQLPPLAVVFGNEVSGVEAEVIKLCDGCIEIPQLGMKHSLNISVAAGIVLWELVRTSVNRATNITPEIISHVNS